MSGRTSASARDAKKELKGGRSKSLQRHHVPPLTCACCSSHRMPRRDARWVLKIPRKEEPSHCSSRLVAQSYATVDS